MKPKAISNQAQFTGHGALPEELKHQIFESIRTGIQEAANRGPLDMNNLHRIADETCIDVQQAVADHMADLTWKLINRRN